MKGKIAYFDNAATTFPKPEVVYDYADSFYRSSGGNAGRGHNALANSATSVTAQAKDNIRQLFECPAHEVVFTSSATDALNRILLGLGIAGNDSVFITPFEHNAVTRPLHHLAQSVGCELHVMEFSTETFKPTLDVIKTQFERNTPKLVVMTHASNVFGNIVPICEIAKLAKMYGATVVVDMSQTAGLVPVRLATDLIDYAVFAGHKTLYGPFGVGGFVCKPSATLKPVLFGGNGINSIEQEMPENIVQMIEVGSQNTYAIAGLKASTDWILGKGVEKLYSAEIKLRSKLIEILQEYTNIKVIDPNNGNPTVGVVSTIFDEYSPAEVELLLSRFGVAVRSGLHCSPYAHRFAGTLPAGTTRFSISAFSDESDFHNLKGALDTIRDE